MRRAAPAVLVVLTASLLGCTHGRPPAPQPVDTGPATGPRGGTLTVLVPGRLDHLDPGRVSTAAGADLARLYARTLVTYGPGPGDRGSGLVPDLATGLGTPSDNARTWTFHLKAGLRFDDGTTITAGDVRFGVERAFDPQLSGRSGVVRELLDCGDGYRGPRTSGDCPAIDVPDDQTLVFHLRRPAGYFPYVAASPAFAPVPTGADTGPAYDDRPVSSGPYAFAAPHRPGHPLELVRNDAWDPTTDAVRAALPDRVVVSAGVSDAAVAARLATDPSAVVLGAVAPPGSSAGSLATSAGTDRAGSGCVDYLMVNTTRRPFDNVKVRQAVAYAVDRAGFRDALGGASAGRLASTLVAPSLAGHRDFNLYPGPATGDPQRARSLLVQTGHAGGLAVSLDVPDTGAGVAEAKALRAGLQAAGLTVRVHPVAASRYEAVVRDPKQAGDLATLRWCPAWPSASAVLAPLFGGLGAPPIAGYAPPDVTERLAGLLANSDPGAAGWADLDERIMQDVPLVPLVDETRTVHYGRAAANVYQTPAFGGRIDLVSVGVSP